MTNLNVGLCHTEDVKQKLLLITNLNIKRTMANFFVNAKGDLRLGCIIGTVVVAIVAVVLFFGSFVIIEAEEVGVPVTLGEIGDTPAYGFTWKAPFFTDYVRFEKTTQRMKLQDQTYTKDLQPAEVKYTFTYKIVPENACELYRSAGCGYESKIIDPALDDALKGVFGRWTATELVANRNKVANQIEERLKEELPKGFFCEISIKLDDISYSDAFEKGIEQKVLAEQEAQKAKNKTVQIEEEGRQKVIQAQAEADAAIAKAEGEARAISIKADGQAKAMDIEGAAVRRNSQYLELRKLDVQQKMAESSSGWETVIMSGGQAQALLNVPSK